MFDDLLNQAAAARERQVAREIQRATEFQEAGNRSLLNSAQTTFGEQFAILKPQVIYRRGERFVLLCGPEMRLWYDAERDYWILRRMNWRVNMRISSEVSPAEAFDLLLIGVGEGLTQTSTIQACRLCRGGGCEPCGETGFI